MAQHSFTTKFDLYAAIVAINEKYENSSRVNTNHPSSGSIIVRSPATDESAKASTAPLGATEFIDSTLQEAIHLDTAEQLDAVGHRQRVALGFHLAARQKKAGDYAGVRKTLRYLLQTFPHDAMGHPSLWIETAKSELLCPSKQTLASSRVIIDKGLDLCCTPEMFQAAIQLEQAELPNAFTDTVEDKLAKETRIRAIFRGWLQKFPLDPTGYLALAEFERSNGERDAADATLEGGIRILTSAYYEDGTVSTVTQRMGYYNAIDRLWKERLADALRQGKPDQVRRFLERITASMVQAYQHQFKIWRRRLEDRQPNADIPKTLSDEVTLKFEISRVQQILRQRVRFELQQHGQTAEAKAMIRADVFKKLIADERRAAIPVDGMFDETQREKLWTELSLGVLIDSWREFEGQYGTVETLRKVSETAEPAKKRSRLFKFTS